MTINAAIEAGILSGAVKSINTLRYRNQDWNRFPEATAWDGQKPRFPVDGLIAWEGRRKKGKQVVTKGAGIAS